jgi:hypothetical protein
MPRGTVVNCQVVDEPNTLMIKLLHPFIRNVQRSSAANKIIVQGSFIASGAVFEQPASSSDHSPSLRQTSNRN